MNTGKFGFYWAVDPRLIERNEFLFFGLFLELSAESRDSIGGTSKRRVLDQIQTVRSRY